LDSARFLDSAVPEATSVAVVRAERVLFGASSPVSEQGVPAGRAVCLQLQAYLVLLAAAVLLLLALCQRLGLPRRCVSSCPTVSVWQRTAASFYPIKRSRVASRPSSSPIPQNTPTACTNTTDNYYCCPSPAPAPSSQH
jgi:hypothetical protein